ncbi:hypothetical protein Pan241w_57260 [Gimesia alba]|uniref:Uncharacterized protein n=1 Tax=Gimesia alba TaxID=2527973 RepID=A0A517RNZ2_9PLAN|nr:hypothetical protein Pan241w_57260 [Gimesia alba]
MKCLYLSGGGIINLSRCTKWSQEKPLDRQAVIEPQLKAPIQFEPQSVKPLQAIRLL